MNYAVDKPTYVFVTWNYINLYKYISTTNDKARRPRGTERIAYMYVRSTYFLISRTKLTERAERQCDETDFAIKVLKVLKADKRKRGSRQT